MPQSALHGGDIYNRQIEYDFSVNINPLGIPPFVIRAMEEAVCHCDVYPQLGNVRLREDIGKSVGLPENYVLCGNGASELLAAVVHAFRPKRVLIPQPAFSGYAWAAQMVHAQIRCHNLREEDGYVVTERLLDELTEAVDMLFLTNPSNPVGAVLEPDLLQDILNHCRDLGIVVVLDECFIEFTGRESACGLVEQYENLIVVRAFTKIYAIPGVRLGYLFAAPAICERIVRQLPEWNLSVLAQKAGLAILDRSSQEWNREEYIRRTVQLIKNERNFLKEELEACPGDTKIKVYPSEANFLLLQTELPLYEELLRQKILVRDCSNYRGLGRGYYRIAVREHDANLALVQAIYGILIKP